MPTLHQLRIFVHVARHLNVTRAAEDLRISQPSVSRQLKKLEARLQAKLFQKNNTGVELTHPGKCCLAHAEAILLEIQRLDEDIAGKALQANKILSVGGTQSACALLLPTALAEFEKAHPTVEVRLKSGGRHLIEEMVIRSDVDIALVTGGGVSSPALAFEPFRQQELVFFVSRHHPAAAANHLKPAQIEEIPIIIRESTNGRGTAEEFLAQLRKRQLSPHVALRCDSPESVKAAVQKNFGMGILYRDLLKSEIKEGKFKILRLNGMRFLRPSFIIYRADKILSPVAAEFLTLLEARKHKRQ
jgi:DNA-binding transcriptional LysR family regulator